MPQTAAVSVGSAIFVLRAFCDQQTQTMRPDYANSVLFGTIQKKNISKLKSTEPPCPFRYPYSSILQFTYTPLAAPLALIKNRIDFKIPNITFRTLYSSQPQPAYLRSSSHVCHSTRSLRLSNSNLLSAAFVRTLFGARSFSVAAPKIWNSLPVSLRTCTSPDTFRRHLKTHYCQQAFQST